MRVSKTAIAALLLWFGGLSSALGESLDADAAVAEILFDYDGIEQVVTYAVRDNGFVDITFPRNTPDALYSEILERLQNHEAIDGVLAGKSGPVCTLF